MHVSLTESLPPKTTVGRLVFIEESTAIFLTDLVHFFLSVWLNSNGNKYTATANPFERKKKTIERIQSRIQLASRSFLYFIIQHLKTRDSLFDQPKNIFTTLLFFSYVRAGSGCIEPVEFQFVFTI